MVLQGVPQLAEVAAVGVPSPGGGPEQLHLFVVPKAASGGADEAALKQQCQAAIRGQLNPLFKVGPGRQLSRGSICPPAGAVLGRAGCLSCNGLLAPALGGGSHCSANCWRHAAAAAAGGACGAAKQPAPHRVQQSHAAAAQGRGAGGEGPAAGKAVRARVQGRAACSSAVSRRCTIFQCGWGLLRLAAGGASAPASSGSLEWRSAVASAQGRPDDGPCQYRNFLRKTLALTAAL